MSLALNRPKSGICISQFTKMKREDLNSPQIKCLEHLLHSEESKKDPDEIVIDLMPMN